MNKCSNWKILKLKEIGTVITGRTPPTANIENFGKEYLFITPSDMDGRKKICDTERKLSSKGAIVISSCKIPSNSVCVSCIGWQMGKVTMTTKTSFTNQQINTIIPNENIIPDFLHYSLSTRREELKTLGSVGTRTPILKKSEFEKLELFLPPYEYQRKIASILSNYDDLIENNTRRIEILEQMAKLVYEEWFVKFRFPGHENVKMVPSELGEIPEGWRVEKLGSVIELAYGKSLTANKRNGGPFPVYGSAGVVGTHNEYMVNGPGIIVGRKGNVGSIFWSNENFFPIDTVFYVKTNVSLHYVYYNLKNQNFINNDAAVPGLNRNQAYLLPFLVPENNILTEFETNIEFIIKEIEILNRKNQNLRKTRDLLLPKLISGEIDVSDLDIRIKNEYQESNFNFREPQDEKGLRVKMV